MPNQIQRASVYNMLRFHDTPCTALIDNQVVLRAVTVFRCGRVGTRRRGTARQGRKAKQRFGVAVVCALQDS